MEILKVNEGESANQRAKNYDLPLKGRQVKLDELEMRRALAIAFGSTNPNGKILVCIDTETGEVIL